MQNSNIQRVPNSDGTATGIQYPEQIDPATPMRTMARLEDVPRDLSGLVGLWRYANKWWDADSDESTGPDGIWQSADLIQAIEQAAEGMPGGPNSHTLPLVLRFATILERVLADHHSRDFVQPDSSASDDPVERRMPSWRVGEPREIYGMLINACTNLARTFNDKSNVSVIVGRKAAIVAVYALMMADLGGALGDWPQWQIERVKGIPSASGPEVS